MTIVEAPSTATPSSTSDWDEARLNAALAKLQATHIQLRNLRDTVPSLLRPLRAELSSPETVYAEFAKAATGAVNNVRDFAKSAREPDVRVALERAKVSKAEHPEGVIGWLAAQHEDWLERPVAVSRLAREEIKREGSIKVEEIVEGKEAESEGREEVVEGFRKRNPGMEVGVEEGVIKVSLPPPARITFRVQASQEGVNNVSTYNVSCEETGKSGKPTRLSTGITQAFSRREKMDDLHHTLDMISVYSHVKTQPCQKCHRLMDREGQFPVVRFLKSTGVSGLSLKDWEALHLGCATG